MIEFQWRLYNVGEAISDVNNFSCHSLLIVYFTGKDQEPPVRAEAVVLTRQLVVLKITGSVGG